MSAPDPYAPMGELADLLDSAGRELRSRAGLGQRLDSDPELAASATASPDTFAEARALAHEATRAALSQAVELDADAVVLRATMLTFRRIDSLQEAAGLALGAIAGRAVGYLAPEVALGGSVVSAGLIEIDAGDRDQMARYLSSLAADHPELLEHFSGGGLIEALQMRSLLTYGMPTGDAWRAAAEAGRAALGIDSFEPAAGPALREAVGVVVDDAELVVSATRETAPAPRGLAELMRRLDSVERGVLVQEVTSGRWIVYLGPEPAPARRTLRLVGSDRSSAAARAVQAVEEALHAAAARGPVHVMLVGHGPSGGIAAQIAAHAPPDLNVDQVVTACSPVSQVPGVPAPTRLLSLEDRSDPVTALGSLVNAEFDNQVLVLFDPPEDDESIPVHGGHVVDRATDPRLREELRRLETLGYLLPSGPQL